MLLTTATAQAQAPAAAAAEPVMSYVRDLERMSIAGIALAMLVFTWGIVIPRLWRWMNEQIAARDKEVSEMRQALQEATKAITQAGTSNQQTIKDECQKLNDKLSQVDSEIQNLVGFLHGQGEKRPR